MHWQRARVHCLSLIHISQAKVPTAMAEALANGRLGVMDYYRLNNIQADTQMRRTIAEVSPEGEETVSYTHLGLRICVKAAICRGLWQAGLLP